MQMQTACGEWQTACGECGQEHHAHQMTCHVAVASTHVADAHACMHANVAKHVQSVVRRCVAEHNSQHLIADAVYVVRL